jgi:tetratricopeptide (TPR) repeat protein
MAYAHLSYDPWELERGEREKRFVGREALLQRMLGAVAEQQEQGAPQHYLLLGPRGVGKTTLLLTLRDRVRDRLSSQWWCVQLREEEYYVQTLRDLLELTLRGLAEEEAPPEAADLAERVHREEDQERSLALAVDGLRALTAKHGKRVLLLVDNFDRVFPATATGRDKERTPESEFRSFRKLLSRESFLMVIGASVRLFDEIASYDRAFFNFFVPVEVPNLTDDEICELLRRCADVEGNTGFLAQFDAMREKVRAITYMTGGNPRLVVMLYDVLRQQEMAPVVQALRETVSGLTPLLKHVLDDMPRQQSKTLDALMRLQGVAAPNEIAKLARLPLNVVTAQLGRLREGRFVVGEGEGKGRPATYRISDPMFRTWYQMRYLRPAGRRVELFVEFIRAWFSVEERRKFLDEKWRELGTGPRLGLEAVLTIQHYAAALEDKQEQWGHVQHLADVLVQGGQEREAAILLAESVELGTLPENSIDSAGYRLLGDRLAKGDLDKAMAAFREALRKEPESTTARLGLGACLERAGEHALAMKEWGRVIGSKGAPVEQVAIALANRGFVKGHLGDSQGAIADYTAVVNLIGAPPGQVARALINRGVVKGQLGDSQGAIADYTAVVELAGTPVEQIARSLFNRGLARGQLGNTLGEIADFDALVELAGAPVDVVASALFSRGAVKAQLGDQRAAIADYTAVVELAGAPVEQVVKSLINRGGAKSRLGDAQGEIADCTAAVELVGAPVEAVATALVNRGITKGQVGEVRGAISDYTAVVELAGAPVEQVATALFNRGLEKGQLGDIQGEIADYTAVVKLASAPVVAVAKALSNRGAKIGQLGNPQGAIADYTVVVELAGAPVEHIAWAFVNRGVAKSQLGDAQGQIADCTAVVELAGVPVQDVARALFNRGLAKGRLGDAQGAIADLTKVVELAGAPVEDVGRALYYRGVGKGQLGDIEGEIAEYTAVVQLAGAPADTVAMALLNRSAVRGRLGDAQGAISDCTAVVELVGVSEKDIAVALVNRGIARGQLGDSKGAIVDCTAVVEMAAAPVEVIARALANRGVAETLLGNLEKAIADGTAVVELADAPTDQVAFALFNCGVPLSGLGRASEAIASLQRCLEMKVSAESVHRSFAGLVSVLLAGRRDDEAAGWMARLHEFEKPDVSMEARLEARIQAIVKAGSEHGPGTAETLLDAALREGPDDVRVRLEFLGPAIQYAKSGDEQALSRLPEREREAAKQIAATITGKKDRDVPRK